MSPSPGRIQFLADRCRLFATAVLLLGVPALIFTGGMVGGATLGITILALAWASRNPPALRRMCRVLAMPSGDDFAGWDTFHYRAAGDEFVHDVHDFDFEDTTRNGSGTSDSWDADSDRGFKAHDPFGADHGLGFQVNPATGYPMISGDTAGVDVAGNPFGLDLSSDHFVATGSSPIDGWP